MSQDPSHRDSQTSSAPSGRTSPPPTRPRKWLRIIVTLLAGGFLTLLICCGVGAYFVQNHGSFIFDPMRKEMNQFAELHEEVGEIQSLNINFFATVEEGEANPEYVILDGTSESGPFQLSVKMANSGDVKKIFLVMDDGNRKPIDMSRKLDADAPDTAGHADSSGAETIDERDAAKDETVNPTETKAVDENLSERQRHESAAH